MVINLPDASRRQRFACSSPAESSVTSALDFCALAAAATEGSLWPDAPESPNILSAVAAQRAGGRLHRRL